MASVIDYPNIASVYQNGVPGRSSFQTYVPSKPQLFFQFILTLCILLFAVTLNTASAQPFCDQAQPGAGFPSDPLCEAAVCLQDLFCCFNTWDGICAGIAANNPACINCIQGGGGGIQLCPTCEDPCGDALGYSTTPTIPQVVADCGSAPFAPPLPSGSLHTFCNSFTATATSVDFNVIITSNCGAGNVTNFNWALYNITCGAPIQTGNLTSLTFSPVVPGNSYTFCYTFNVPFGCTHEIHCPYFVGATVDPCPTAELNYPDSPFCGVDSNSYPADLTGSGAYQTGSYSATPVGLSINAGTGAINPESSAPGDYVVSYTIPASGSCDEIVVTANVTIEEATTPGFDTYGPYCTDSNIPPLPGTSNNGVTGTWSPAIDNTTTTTYTFLPNDGQCATSTTLQIEIDSEIDPLFPVVGPYCSGDDVPALPTMSQNDVSGSWSPEIDNTATTTYTFTPDDGQCGIPTTLQIVINELVTPEFDAAGPFCEGSEILDLPVVSNNGVSGSWSPEMNNSATTTYTFTPNDGQCAVNSTLQIIIDPETVPEFEPSGPYCAGANIPELPATSINGVTGTWSPAINNTVTTSYTFTPFNNECASPVVLTIAIDDEIVPEFDPAGPFCEGTNIPALPTTSVNGVTGTWSPNINNTATTTYTFTPNDGQCGTITTLQIVIDSEITPLFDPVDAYCTGSDIPELPVVSNNGISGSWSPNINNTATTTYTFAPDAGQCAAQTTTTISVSGDENNTIPVSACDDYTWPLSGETYFQGGEYAVVLESAQGCDSTITLSLTINQSTTSTSSHSACQSYLWNGQIYAASGVYYSESLNPAGCISQDTLILTILPEAQTTIVSVEICAGDEYLIGGIWQSTSGTYNEFYTAANGCDSIVQIQLTVLPETQARFSATPSVATVFDEYIQFYNESTFADSVEWDFGDFGTYDVDNPLVNFNQNPGRYPFCITVWSDDGCTDQNCFVYVVRDEFSVYIPNAFSANEDGINDLFYVQGVGIDPNDFHLRIFNRWGELVFESRDLFLKWNGEAPGGKHYMQNEVYVYHLVVGSLYSTEKRELKGTVTVVR